MTSSPSSFESTILPVLALRDKVVFPHAISALEVVRPQATAALEAATRGDRRAFLVCQLDPQVEAPGRGELHEVGTVAEILQALHLPDGSWKVLVEGLFTARAIDLINSGDHHRGLVVRQDPHPFDAASADTYRRTALGLFEDYARMSQHVAPELYASIKALEDPMAVVHALANYSGIAVEEKQAILEAPQLEEKYLILNSNLEQENQLLELEDQVAALHKGQPGERVKDVFVTEQLRAIERELKGSSAQKDDDMELGDLTRRVEAAGLPAEARDKANKELARMGRMAPTSPEATVARTYVEWLTEVPWHAATADEIDLRRAREILDADHYGLEKVKERIIEYLAVTKLAGRAKGPILCLVGPPGVGKTSLARSVARCVGRQFARLSLGGVRDEAEIRGHRRTYIGAMPGKILQSMKKAGTVNPVLLLDEIDKMASDLKGDPAAALLEVLDPEQNATFNDHYLEVDYDLSRVMFITTANTMVGIPLPLQDRMEVIRLSGYTDTEKYEIARRHLVPKAIANNGLKKSAVRFRKPAVMTLIQSYTREAGVRSLEREIDAVLRKIATRAVVAAENAETMASIAVTPELVRQSLGPERFKDTALDRQPEVGNALGLAWTETGGALLHVETRVMPGRGDLTLTGTLGDVMKESARTALSFIRSHAADLGIDDPNFHEKCDIHIHLPEGAIPKDGPSAGITLATALVSALAGRPVRQDVAMTGEMTLRGRVLKIGGLKEKVLAAYRHKILTVIMPEENVADLEDIPTEVRQKMIFVPVVTVLDALKAAFPAAKSQARRKPQAAPQPRP